MLFNHIKERVIIYILNFFFCYDFILITKEEKKNAKALIRGNGVFKKFGAADAKVIYYFDDLVLLAQPSFPDKFAWLLTNAIIKGEKELLGATSPLDIRKIADIHPGTLMALNNEKMPELIKK